MNIRPNSSDSPINPLRFDPTKHTREVIQSRQPLQPAPDDAAQQDAEGAAQQVKEARDAYREKFKGRVANARQHYTANQNEQKAADVAQARDAYEVKLDRRRYNVDAAREAAANNDGGADSIDISARSRDLLEQVRGLAHGGDAERAERVQALRARYLEGKLEDGEMAERAARKMLGGE
jgi:hypothetical protein